MNRSLVRSIGSLIGIGGVAFCITLISLGMRSVESVGGTCASGGPYQIARPCPAGVAAALPLGIIGGLVFLGIFAFCASDKGRTVTLLAWPALFLTLAWNFIDYGLKGGNSSGGAGFLIPGVLFVIMGAAPLFWVVPSMWRAFLGKDDEDAPAATMRPFIASPNSGWLSNLTNSANSGWGSSTPSTPSTPTTTTAGATSLSTPIAPTATSARVSPAPTSTSSSAGGPDLSTELERLASLHRRGELTDAEYESAKQRALGGTS
ncbi:MAG TPA: SHOCT domain-containing protein [Acidimicrobiia bacterium]|nr:SHOCT domain-containing protein [Acidimicrobiia bacterium]